MAHVEREGRKEADPGTKMREARNFDGELELSMSPSELERIKEELLSLLREQDDEQLLSSLHRILKHEDQKEVKLMLRVLSKVLDEEQEEEERDPILMEKLRSRARQSEEDIKAGRTLSLEEVDRRNEELLRKYYEG